MGQSYAIMVGLCGRCQIVLQQVLVYTDVLVGYENLCLFQEWWPVSRPWTGLDHRVHLRVAILRCTKEAQHATDVPLSPSFVFVKDMLDEEFDFNTFVIFLHLRLIHRSWNVHICLRIVCTEAGLGRGADVKNKRRGCRLLEWGQLGVGAKNDFGLVPRQIHSEES